MVLASSTDWARRIFLSSHMIRSKAMSSNILVSHGTRSLQAGLRLISMTHGLSYSSKTRSRP
jgi:hypothetical protein